MKENDVCLVLSALNYIDKNRFVGQRSGTVEIEFWSCNAGNAAITSNQRGFMGSGACKFSRGWSANSIVPT